MWITITLLPPPSSRRTPVAAMAASSLTPEQLAACMAANGAWAFPAKDDGWVRAHDALRLDMTDFGAALAVLAAQDSAGKALTAWQVNTLTSNWERFAGIVHFHHHNEDALLFPWLETRAPAEALKAMSGEHETLVKLMDKCNVGFATLKKTAKGGETLTTLVADYAQLKECMFAHLLQEEEVGLPLMRHHFVSKEFKPIEKKILEHATTVELAWVLRPMGDDAAKRDWMTRVAHIPGPVQSLIILPAVRRYNRDVVVPITALCSGATEAPPPPDAGCACCVM